MQKPKTKRHTATILIVALISVFLVMGLTACGDSEPEPTPAPAATPAPVATPEPTPEPEPEETTEETPEPEENDADLSLIGTWRWADDDSFVYNFHADGTGVRGFEWQGLTSFQWDMDDSTLGISTLAIFEHWSFAVVEEDGIFVLAIESLQVPGLVFAYMFTEYVEDVAPEDYSILLGAWAHVDEFGNVHPWDYVFFSDGSGIRGTTENFDVFYWEADYETGELVIYIPAAAELWDIDLKENTFTASSPDLPGVRLVYDRVN